MYPADKDTPGHKQGTNHQGNYKGLQIMEQEKGKEQGKMQPKIPNNKNTRCTNPGIREKTAIQRMRISPFFGKFLHFLNQLKLVKKLPMQ